MFAQRQALRALRSPMIQRRLASTTPKAGESAFAAERRAVKEHAAHTAGRWWMGRQGNQETGKVMLTILGQQLSG